MGAATAPHCHGSPCLYHIILRQIQGISIFTIEMYVTQSKRRFTTMDEKKMGKTDFN